MMERCEHRVRWPHQCDECDDTALKRLHDAAPMLLDGAQDAVEAFKVLRVGMLDNKAAIEVIDAHIDELNYAIAKASPPPLAVSDDKESSHD